MVNLSSDGRAVRWFVWSCDHLPLTVTREYGEGLPHDGVRRTGAYYVGRGTTLCHLFWATLWVPLLIAAIGAFAVLLFVIVHVVAYQEHSVQFGVAAAFIPEGIMLIMILLAAVTIFSVVGASKSGLLKLLWPYLKGLKDRVCPIVRFSP